MIEITSIDTDEFTRLTFVSAQRQGNTPFLAVMDAMGQRSGCYNRPIRRSVFRSLLT